jgi:tetratricopeptide (TPR) repeat protein/ferredoxin
VPLTVLQDRPARPTAIRRSRAGRWRAAVLILVYLVAAAHFLHWRLAGRTLTPVEPSESMALARDGVVNAGLVFFALAALSTALFGRWFCGWGCHIVALQDLCLALLKRLGIRPRPLGSRLLAWVPAAAFVYMFLWPAAWRLWHRAPTPRVQAEWTTTQFWATFPGWAVGGLTFLVCGFAIVYFLGAKGFCFYACPYGALFAAADRVSPMRIRVTDACSGCAHCTAVCTSNVRVHQEVRDYGMVVDPGCMKCGDCVSVCPNDALYYGKGPIALFARPRVPDPEPRRFPLARWEEAVLGVAFAAAFLAFRGLYGLVPFLLALGLAGVLAYLVLTAARLVRLPNVTLRKQPLKRGGRLQPAGYGFLAALAAVALLWGDSALVRLHSALGERDFAAADTLRAAFLDPTAESATMTADERDRLLAARDHLKAAERWGLAPNQWQALRLAWLAELVGDRADLDRYAALALQRGEAPAEVHQLLARDAWRRGDAQAAAAAYESAIAAAPADPVPYLGLGVLKARLNDLEGARVAFERGLASRPDSADLAYNLGLVRGMAGDLPGAIAGFERALALNPDHRAARENLDAARAARAAAPGPPGPP